MVSAPGITVRTADPVPRWGRRRLRLVVGLVVAVLLLFVLASGGVAWYFSGVALAVDHSVSYPQTVQAVIIPSVGARGSGAGATGATGTASGSGASVLLRLTRDADTAAPGVVGLVWAGGYGRLGSMPSSDTTTVTRQFVPVTGGIPQAGTRVRTDSYAYAGDPVTALGLSFSEVRVTGPLGALPAWFVPPPAGSSASGPGSSAAPSAGGTWVVFVHGHDGDRQESLRYLRTWHALGLPVLVPTYRDDVGAPSSPDGFHHLGDTEWQDVAAAVHWARDHGATGVVLAGWSMGGSIALQTVDRSDVAGMVRGLLLDSPVLDWRDVFAAQGADRGVPQLEVTFAEWVLQWRAGISLDRLDWVARAGQLRRPTLILHSDGDEYVPDGPAIRLAAARPDLVTLVRIPGAGHTMDWNVDPTRYDDAVRDWLARLPS